MQTEAPIELIIAWCEGSISEADHIKLQSWRQAHAHHEQFFRRFESIWNTVQPSSSSFQPDVEKALMKVHHRMGRRFLIRRAVQVAALFIVLLGVWQLFRMVQPNSPQQYLVAQQQQTLYLPDSTKVVLAEGARLEYPLAFDADERLVKLQGKAWFDVHHNAKQPFVIRTRKAQTTVLGTQFTLISTADGKEEVYLDEGRVSYTTRGWFAETAVLKPGEKAIIKEGNLTKSVQVNQNASSWATHKLTFKNTPLYELIVEMQHYYGVTIQLQTERIGQLRFTGTLSHATAEEALRVVAMTLKLKLIHDNQTLTLSL